jgi:uncharacterized protein YacL
MLDIIQTFAIALLAVAVIYKIKPVKVAKSGAKATVLDSCALIDGRIVELVRAGFISNNLIVPEFIVAELQLLADGSDSHKRERARFGLEVVRQLQAEPGVNLTINKIKIDEPTTDDKLVTLAKKIQADLYTTDFNLNQVANIKGVRVLNINELSQAMRPVALPGEGFEVKIIQGGSNKDQGVGYMEDGTMVVVDNAKRDIGKTIKVNITRTHQTVAGKMLFAEKVTTQQRTQAQPKKQTHTKRQDQVKNELRKRSTGNTNRPRPTKSESALFDAIDKANS